MSSSSRGVNVTAAKLLNERTSMVKLLLHDTTAATSATEYLLKSCQLCIGVPSRLNGPSSNLPPRARDSVFKGYRSQIENRDLDDAEDEQREGQHHQGEFNRNDAPHIAHEHAQRFLC